MRRAALLALAVVLYGGACVIVEDVRLHETVKRLELGMPEDQVLQRLGFPSDSGTEFYLGQKEGFEVQYRAAAESPSVRYLFWRGGVAGDVVCAVGLDLHNRVSYRACGGT